MPHRRPTPETLNTSALRSYNSKLQYHKGSPHIKDSNATTFTFYFIFCKTTAKLLAQKATAQYQRRWIPAHSEATKATLLCPKVNAHIKNWNAMMFKVCRSQPANFLASKANAQHLFCSHAQ